MSSPQVENGYTRIANELLDAIVRYPFTRREYAIIMLIIRMTYGYNKKEDAISFWQIAEITGINRSDVSKSIADLVAKNVIIKTENGRFSHGQSIPFLAVNKHYKQWATVIKTPTVKTVSESPTVTDGELHTVGETPPSANHLTTVGDSPTETVGETPQEPSVKHHTHKDSKNNKDISKRHIQKSTLPQGFGISDRVRHWALENGHENLEIHFQSFVLKATAKGYKYVDWDAAFMNAIRDDWAKVSQSKVVEFKSSGQRRLENTDKAVKEFLGEQHDSANVIDGEYSHA
jgi:phage replication O-like protein O